MRSALKHEESTLELRSRRAELKERLDSLSDGERDVLHELLNGLANKQIAGKLDLGLRTIELRRSNVLKKMKARSLAEVVQMVEAAVAKAEPGEWILGRGWHQEKWDRIPAGAVTLLLRNEAAELVLQRAHCFDADGVEIGDAVAIVR